VCSRRGPRGDAILSIDAVTDTFTFAHLSDLHLSSPADTSLGTLLGKRALGYLSWRWHRRSTSGAAAWAALVRDVEATRPDHVLITGDLTQLGLPTEFTQVRRALENLGDPSRVTLVPGNHDVYRADSWAPMVAHWAPYVSPDAVGPPALDARMPEPFPTLRVHGGVAIIGVSTARPSAPFLAVGSVGPGQQRRLADVLAETRGRGLFRVVLMHHPPTLSVVSWRKRLTDAPALRAIVAEHGAELILHGHAHLASLSHLPGATGRTLVVGAPAATPIGERAVRRARYYLGRVTPTADGWRLRLELRSLSPDGGEADIADVCDVVVDRHPPVRPHESADPAEEPQGEGERRARRNEGRHGRGDVKE
jgi:3',5'-cyclic AMP phosphodiesterase CpdA